MEHLSPTAEQIHAFSEHPHTGPIWMWNLLRFKEGAGRDTYQRYVEGVKPLIEKRGGRILNRSRGKATMIGPDSWDEALVIEYPSRSTFLEMVSSTEYQAIAQFRQDAIEDSRLYMMTELPIPE
jgi:uncharacterized protein (DUF1330 family)